MVVEVMGIDEQKLSKINKLNLRNKFLNGSRRQLH
jgi:hypothetical protein